MSVANLLRAAPVVKLDEREVADVHRWLELPADPEAFCRAGAGAAVAAVRGAIPAR